MTESSLPAKLSDLRRRTLVSGDHHKQFKVVLSISNIGTDRDPRELLLWRASAEIFDGSVVASAPMDRL